MTGLMKKINTIIFIIIMLFLIGLIIFIFISTLFAVYTLFHKLILFITKNNPVSIYMSITAVLILYAYIPNIIGTLFVKFLNLGSSVKTNILERYINSIELIRVKLIIYFLAFLIVAITSVEDYMDLNIIKISIWSEVKPFILQAVVTFIAYDRFHKAFSDEFPSIKIELTTIFKRLIILFKNK
ncbi:hypothetical protein [Paenibacillus kyungheensis]